MKNSILALLALVFVVSACNKDDESPSYSEADFYGSWELSNSTSEDYQECPDDTPILEISETELIAPVIDGNGCMMGTFSTNYTFSGDKFSVSVFGQSVDYSITSYSESEFTWEDNFEGNQETYVRVQ